MYLLYIYVSRKYYSDCSVSSIEWETICHIFLEASSVHIFLVVQEIEIRFEWILSEGIVWVCLCFVLLEKWGFDIPKDTVWNCIENLESFRLCQALFISILNILNVAVWFIILEDWEFLIKNLFELISSIWIELLKFLNKCDFQFIVVFSWFNWIVFLFLDLFEFFSQFVFILQEGWKFLVFHFIEECTIL